MFQDEGVVVLATLAEAHSEARSEMEAAAVVAFEEEHELETKGHHSEFLESI